MRAAVQAARGKADPPPQLTLLWDCRRWDKLPDLGGVRAQDYQLMHQMKTLDSLYWLKRAQLEATKDKPLPLEKQQRILQLIKLGVWDG